MHRDTLPFKAEPKS